MPLDSAGGAGTGPLGPRHIPCRNGSIGLPRMKVNTPAKPSLDKTDPPRPGARTWSCERLGTQTGGGS